MGMNKAIVFSTATLQNKAGLLYEGIKELVHNLHKDGEQIIIMSHDHSKVAHLKSEFNFAELCFRWQVRERLKKDTMGSHLIVGGNDDDLHIAANTKTALLFPQWSDVQEEKARHYGFGIFSPKALYKVIQIIKNQKVWFYELRIDDSATVYSLTSANSNGNVEQSEKEMVEGFRQSLKHGKKKYFKALQLHFLASIIHNQAFREVDLWSIMPSSGNSHNEDLWALKERARILMGKRLTKPLFIRHTPIRKSHSIRDINKRLLCDRHFASLNINPEYRRKLKGKVVCILDDYLTNGTSFETLRNLLVQAGVKKMIFVSLGRFRRYSGIEYYKQDYELSGNIFSSDYSFKSLNCSNIKGTYDERARDEIRSLYDFIYS